MSIPGIHSTTILCVRRDAHVALGGDGQVTIGETVMKANANKVRTLKGGKILAGFAGAAADAFTLFEKFEEKLERYPGNLPRGRSSVEGLALRPVLRRWRRPWCGRSTVCDQRLGELIAPTTAAGHRSSELALSSRARCQALPWKRRNRAALLEAQRNLRPPTPISRAGVVISEPPVAGQLRVAAAARGRAAALV